MKTSCSLVAAVPALFLFAACQSAPQPQPDRFDAVDANKDGMLSGGEISDFFVTGIFEARDTDKDGKITAQEWNPEMNAKESGMFAEHDLNKDGAVTLGEARIYARQAGIYTKVVKEADTDKDGKVSRAEAQAYYASKEGPVR